MSNGHRLANSHRTSHPRRARPSLHAHRRGVAALEFALVMPVLVMLLFGVVDATRALLAWQQVTSTAQQVAEIGTALADDATDGSNTYQLKASDAYAASTAIYAYMPALKPGGGDASSFGVTVTAVAFTASPARCTNDCTYTAQTRWSLVGVAQVAQAASVDGFLRPCGKLTQTPAGSPPTLDTLPILTTPPLTGMTSLLVADVQYTFTPLFLKFVLAPIPMHRAAYLPPRVGAAAAFIALSPTASNAAVTVVCTG